MVKRTIESSEDVADAETSSTKPIIPKTQQEEACINAAVINKSSGHICIYYIGGKIDQSDRSVGVDYIMNIPPYRVEYR